MTDQPRGPAASRPPASRRSTPAAAAAPSRAAAAPPPAPAGRRQIPIDDFMKIDLRVAKVLAAEKVQGLEEADQDAGGRRARSSARSSPASRRPTSPRHWSAASIVIVANLKPAKLMGIESNGMVLAASPEGGLPVLLGFDRPAAARASRVRALPRDRLATATWPTRRSRTTSTTVVGARAWRRRHRAALHPGARRRRGSRAADAVSRPLWPGVRFAVGVHPHQAHEFAGRAAEVVAAVQAAARRAAGARRRSARSASTTTTTSRRATCSGRSSGAQVELARESGLPVVIHTREADDDTLAIIRRGGRRRGAAASSTASRATARLADEALGARVPAVVLRASSRSRRRGVAARRRGTGPGRPAAGRDRLPVPGAGAAPGHAATSRPASPGRRRPSPGCGR